MKKLAMIAAGALCAGCLSAFEMPDLGVNAEAKYSSEYVTRGRKEGRKVFLPKAEVSMTMFEKGKLYTGTYAALGVDGNYADVRNQVSPYIGASYDVTDMFTLDAGYVHHLYTNTPKRANGLVQKLDAQGKPEKDAKGNNVYVDGTFPTTLRRNSSELYFGVLADVLLSPSLYFYYDFGAKEVAIEGKVAYTFDFAQFGVNGLALDLGAKLGYDKADRPHGFKTTVPDFNKKIDDINKGKKDADANAKLLERFGKNKGYVYYGLSADLVYSFNEHAKARAGVACEGNSAKKESMQNAMPFAGTRHHKNFVWFNASVDCTF